MNYGKKSPSMGTPSIYSHVTTRSSANLRSSRSVKSVKIPWYQRPLLTRPYILDIQRTAMLTAVFSFLLAIFTIATSIFDVYCLHEAAPGTTHFGYYIISYEFVYVGNKHIRNALIVGALFSLLGSIALLVTSVILINALRKEYERRMIPWLYCFGIFTVFRFLVYLFFCIVNDMIFAYNIMICLLWLFFLCFSVYGWLTVHTLYIELSDLTRLEDLAHLRIGTMQSLNASTTHSIAGSRPTTPHSTVSTMPVN
ncbi:uncharacterized protein LOC130673493 [Microplitis mediator]|uniref:uncharacterized protein LOC103572743 n=1 Tax=Microplitis demolitor TaxID=69319 RepID=UPI0004CDADF6|nr:uncharacterized protein LOC103572743 [Microplitis demolitor]XP_057334497.1 uncharacterized protein LOC130673493 [Microplitis mediator]